MATGAPNIVLVMSDQHRADMMGCAGDASVAHAVARRTGRRGRPLLTGVVPGPAVHAGAGLVHDGALRARPRRLHELVRDPARQPDLCLGPAGGRLPHVAPGQGAPLPRRAAHRAPHRRHGRAARGAGIRRGLRDGRQVRRQDPDPLHRLPRRVAACSTPTRSTSPTAATRARTRTARTRPSACRCGTPRRCPSRWSPTSTPGTASRRCSGSRATTARSRSSSSWGSPGRMTPGTRRRRPCERYRGVDISMPRSTRRPTIEGTGRYGALLNSFLWVSDSETMTDDAIRGMRTSYAADISVIDQAVGDMVGALERSGPPGHHVDHLHQRPRRDGRQPRADVQVRPVRAGRARAR